jgi:DNA-directed RNA polymerase specialized sigma24 family protein
MKLEPKQRAVWIATEIEGYTFKELAAKWEEPIGTLLSRKSRATKILRKLLKDNV